MPKQIVSRTFESAAFAFDLRTQNSIFVEGTSSELVSIFLEDPNALVPQNYWQEIPADCLAMAQQEVEELRDSIKNFLVEIEEGDRESKQGVTLHGVVGESPLRQLSNYAVENWQVTNVSLEMTYQCNLRCDCCYLDDLTQLGMSRQELQSVADQLKMAGVAFVLFTGGEAFLRRDIIEVMSDFRDRGFALEAKSNGLLLNQKLVEQLADLQLFNLQVSVYGVKDGQTSFTGRPYPFNLLAKNLREMLAQGLPLSLAVLVGKHNVDDLERYDEVLRELGAGEIFYSPYITPNRNGVGRGIDLRLSRKEMDEKFLPFLEKVEGLVSPVKYREPCKGAPACYAGRDQLAIDPQGTVFPCLDFRLPLGNLRQEDFCRVIERRQRLLEPYKLEKIEKCCHCPIVEYCDSCVGTALLENGRFTEPSQHKCDISRFYHDSYLRREEVIV